MDFADIDQGRVLTSLSDQLDVGVEEERDSFLFWMLMGDLTIFTEVTSTIPVLVTEVPLLVKENQEWDFLSWGYLLLLVTIVQPNRITRSQHRDPLLCVCVVAKTHI